MRCRVTKNQTHNKNNRSHDRRREVKQVRVAHQRMNAYRSGKPDQA